MRTKLINSSRTNSLGYGAGSGDIEYYEYECPCGKGLIFEEHDNIPGFREHEVYINCKECEKNYELDVSNGVRNWSLRRK